MCTVHPLLENGEMQSYFDGDEFVNSNNVIYVIASDKQGLYGDQYHVCVKRTDGSPASVDALNISIKEFVEFNQNNDEYTYVLRDIPEQMKTFAYKTDAVACFDLVSLRNCYYPYWW